MIKHNKNTVFLFLRRCACVCRPRLKLSSEVVIIIVFLMTALLRSADTKAELVATGRALTEADLTAEDKVKAMTLSRQCADSPHPPQD